MAIIGDTTVVGSVNVEEKINVGPAQHRAVEYINGKVIVGDTPSLELYSDDRVQLNAPKLVLSDKMFGTGEPAQMVSSPVKGQIYFKLVN